MRLDNEPGWERYFSYWAYDDMWQMLSPGEQRASLKQDLIVAGSVSAMIWIGLLACLG